MSVRRLVLLPLLFLALSGGRAGAWSPPDLDHHYYPESRSGQVSTIIDCSDGKERLCVATASPPVTGAGWIMAIPARAETVAAEWNDDLIRVGGRTPPTALEHELRWITFSGTATQLYPLFCLCVFPPVVSRAAEIAPPMPDVTSGGRTCRIRNADSPDELRRLVAERGLELSAPEFDRISAFADGHHCFAVVTISSMEDYEACLKSADYSSRDLTVPPPWQFDVSGDKMPYVEFSFPSQRPIMPAYAFGKLEKPFNCNNIVVLDYVLPDHPIAGLTALHSQDSLREFRGFSSRYRPPYDHDLVQPGKWVRYTRLYTRDQGTPEEIAFVPKTGFAFLADDLGYDVLTSPVSLVVLSLIWIGLCSYLAGGITGRFFEQSWRRSARLGLWNLTTIIGLRLRLGRYPEIKVPRYYLYVFSPTFLGLNLVGNVILSILLGPYYF